MAGAEHAKGWLLFDSKTCITNNCPPSVYTRVTKTRCCVDFLWRQFERDRSFGGVRKRGLGVWTALLRKKKWACRQRYRMCNTSTVRICGNVRSFMHVPGTTKATSRVREAACGRLYCNAMKLTSFIVGALLPRRQWVLRHRW